MSPVSYMLLSIASVISPVELVLEPKGLRMLYSPQFSSPGTLLSLNLFPCLFRSIVINSNFSKSHFMVVDKNFWVWVKRDAVEGIFCFYPIVYMCCLKIISSSLWFIFSSLSLFLFWESLEWSFCMDVNLLNS